jgi:hypothetical protein
VERRGSGHARKFGSPKLLCTFCPRGDFGRRRWLCHVEELVIFLTRIGLVFLERIVHVVIVRVVIVRIVVIVRVVDIICVVV